MRDDPWDEMDKWCARQCDRLRKPMADHVLAGRNLNDKHFRRKLGMSDAFLKMRSFIHGARNA